LVNCFLAKEKAAHKAAFSFARKIRAAAQKVSPF
jgi:hypothetical protein